MASRKANVPGRPAACVKGPGGGQPDASDSVLSSESSTAALQARTWKLSGATPKSGCPVAAGEPNAWQADAQANAPANALQSTQTATQARQKAMAAGGRTRAPSHPPVALTGLTLKP
jgi:hypothetical protein